MMKDSKVLSFDLCGTLNECNVYNSMWYEVIPEMYAKLEGISLEEAKKALIKAYNQLGPNKLEWYLPSYWINKFGLNYEEFLKKCKNIKINVPSNLNKLKVKYRLILSTNVSKEVLEFSLLNSVFDRVYSSVDMGYPKKDERFWKEVIETENLLPHELIHFGDDYVYDYLIPSSLGARSKLSNTNNLGFNVFYMLGIRL